MRTAYLELLKLSLCDLVGARTLSVTRSGEGRDNDEVFSRELRGEELKLRASGADWPYSGLTMVGLERLDDVQACVESVLADGVEGDLIEAGTWRGGAAMLMRAVLDAHGDRERTVWAADSFQGLPAPDADGFPEDRELDLSGIDFLAVSLGEVQGHFARLGLEQGVRFVPGFFDDTLPGLRGQRWSMVRLDGDTYESTWLALDSLYPDLAEGGFLIVDDYQLIEECRDAVEDYRRAHGISDPVHEIDWNSVRWRRGESPRRARRSAPERSVGVESAARAPQRPAEVHVPTRRELELERELAELRQRTGES